MELEPLLEKLRMEHLGAQLDTICEQAAKRELGYREFLLDALNARTPNGRAATSRASSRGSGKPGCRG